MCVEKLREENVLTVLKKQDISRLFSGDVLDKALERSKKLTREIKKYIKIKVRRGLDVDFIKKSRKAKYSNSKHQLMETTKCLMKFGPFMFLSLMIYRICRLISIIARY